jgi:hypothetical protein
MTKSLKLASLVLASAIGSSMGSSLALAEETAAPKAPAASKAPAAPAAPASKTKAKAAAGKTATTEGKGEAPVSPASLPPYGMGGCGLGSLVIEKNETLPQLGVTFLNNAISPQTSAITSGTSNCTDKAREVASVEQEVFISANLNSISKEAAQGHGTTIEALGEVFGCSEDGTAALKVLCQDKHQEIFSSGEPTKVLSSLRDEIRSNDSTAMDCDRA